MGRMGRNRFMARKMRCENPIGGGITDLAQGRGGAAKVMLVTEEASKKTHISPWQFGW